MYDSWNNNQKIVEIWRKFIIFPEILKAQKRQTKIWKSQGRGYFEIINSRILLLKKVYEKMPQIFSKALDDLQIRPAIVMFRWTPCIYIERANLRVSI